MHCFRFDHDAIRHITGNPETMTKYNRNRTENLFMTTKLPRIDLLKPIWTYPGRYSPQNNTFHRTSHRSENNTKYKSRHASEQLSSVHAQQKRSILQNLHNALYNSDEWWSDWSTPYALHTLRAQFRTIRPSSTAQIDQRIPLRKAKQQTNIPPRNGRAPKRRR